MKSKRIYVFGLGMLVAALGGTMVSSVPLASAMPIGPSGIPAVRVVHGPNSCDTVDPSLRTWCTQCVSIPNQHYHPDCPQGSRCSPNNGQNQCGGGVF